VAPKRIAEHEDRIRANTCEVLGRLEGRETCDLVTDVAQPVVARVIGSFMGIPPEDDQMWADMMNSTLAAADPDVNPDGVDAIATELIPKTPAQLALAWLLHRSERILLIPGTSSIEHLEENVAAGNIELDQEDMQRLQGAPRLDEPTRSSRGSSRA
jgi:hypothetical protein